MDVPLPAVAPVTPLCTTVHEKVAPDTLEVKAMPDADPLQISCEAGVAMAVGMGLTVMVNDLDGPSQVTEFFVK